MLRTTIVAGFFGLAAVFGATSSQAQSVPAPTGPAFDCTGDIYQVQSGQLRIFDPITSSYTDIGSQNSPYNATGYNINDNYAYASQGNNLIRIAADGTIQTVLTIGHFGYSGDVDYDDNFWLRKSHSVYTKVDLITGAISTVSFSSVAGGPADVAFVESGSDQYLIGFTGGGKMFRYNLDTLVQDDFPVSGLPSGGHGATWTDANGRMFTFNNNTGQLFEVFGYLGTSPTFTLVGQGDKSGNNDGFSCSLEPFPNLAPLAFDDAYTEVVNTPVSGNVTLDNGNGVDNDPDGGPITVNTTPLSGPSNGTLVLNADGTFTYTPDNFFVGVDTFEYEIIDEATLTATATVTITITGDIEFTLEKTQTGGPSPVTDAGQIIEYEVVLVNTGDVPLTDVDASDSLPDGSTGTLGTPVETGAVSTPVTGQLDVGETWTYTITYEVTQDDIDSGTTLTNSASATTAETGATPQTDTASTPVSQDPRFSVLKEVDDDELTGPGILNYTVTVENTGTVTLTGLSLTDDLEQGGTALSGITSPNLSGDTDGDGELDVDEIWVYTLSYSVTQAQIDDGGVIENTATFDTAQTGPSMSSVQTTIDQDPSFTVEKSVSSTLIDGPETLTFQVVVRNTGNISLTNPVFTDTVTQDGTTLPFASGPTLSGDGDGDGELDLTETWIYTSTVVVTQAMIDDGNPILNSASFDPAEEDAVTDDTSTAITQTPAMSLTKTVAPGESTSFDAVGDQISFRFTVTNDGNTSLVAPILVTDDQIGTNLTCITSDILPGDSAFCDLVWTADQADLNAGSVTNTATATDDEGTSTAPQSATVTAVQNPELQIVKSIVAPVPTIFQAGQVLFYEYVVTNVGNVDLNDPVTVTDSLITAPNVVTCDPNPGLSPLGTGGTNSLTCTGSYTLTPSDELLGSTTNLAFAETTFGTDPVVSPNDDATFPVDAAPVLNLTKSAPDTPVSEVGQIILYTFTVRNDAPAGGTGAALASDIFINDNKFTDPILCRDASAEGDSLRVGESHTCTAEYMVTQADLDAGSVENEAVASTVFAEGSPDPIPVNSPAVTETVPVEETPGLTVAKTVTGGNDPAAEGDVITYSIVATNSGNQTLNTVAISDPLLGALTCDLAAPVTLLRGESLTCTGSYTVMLSDIDGQTVGDADTAVFTNTAEATANDPAGDPIAPASGEADHPLEEAAPAVSVLKELFPDPSADPAFSAVGDTLRFQITVTNSGNMSLSGVDVTDSLVSGTCSVGALEPGDSDASCFFDYTVTQDDLDAGEVVNTASASAQPIDPDAAPVEGSDELTSPGAELDGALEVIKTSSLDLGSDGVASVGDVISYVIVVRNSGPLTIFNTVVTDPQTGTVTYASGDDTDGDLDIDELAPGESATVTATYPLDQDDIDAGFVNNTATATGSDPSGETVTDDSDSGAPGSGAGPDDPTVTPITRTPGLTVDKSASPASGAAEGDTITYSYLVTNTGNVTLTDVTLVDAHTSASGVSNLSLSSGGVISTLLPGDSVTLTATYVVTQDDIDADVPLTNEVSATSTSPAGTTPPTASDDESVPLEDVAPALEALKTVTAVTGSMAGDTVTFEVTVENTGNTTLTTVTLADTLRRANGVVTTPAPTPVWDTVDTGTAGALDVGETWTYSVTYALTQADIDAGGINNSVTATGTAPNGDTARDVSDNGAGDGNDPTVVGIPADPSLEVIKTITSTTVALGGTVEFEITVENTGNVTLTGVAIASDTLTRADGTVLALTGPNFAASDMSSAPGTLQVGETATYRATYVLTQEDIDAGGIANTATAVGSPPNGAPVSDVSDDNGPGDDPTVLDIPAEPEILFEKRLAAGSGPTFDAVGDVLTYEFEITNDGNVTLTGPFSVADPLITDAGGTITCDAGPIGPGDSLICTGSYAVTQDDLDAGEVLNTAEATAGTAPPVTDDADVPALQLPALELAKVADPVEAEDFIVGAVVGYTYTTTNTGNVTITAPITVTDNRIPASGITCDPFPTDGIAPGDTYECRGTYTVTSDDVALAVVTNNASASDGTTTSPIASETIPNDGVPALSIEKELIASYQPDATTDSGGLSFDEVGDVLEYEFTVSNTGSVSFANPITVMDDRIAGDITCFTPSAANPDLIPGESATCTGTYVVTQDDLDAGEVVNQAVASTEFGSIPTLVVTPPATETALADGAPGVTVEKTVDVTAFSAVDEVITYSIEVTNTGNQTLTDVEATDPLIPGLVCEADVLAVGAVLSCSADYTITQADIDRGSLANTATATGIDPRGEAIPESTGDVSIPGPSVAPTIDLVKSALPDPFGPLGSSVVYTFTVENTSIYTLSNVVVTDPADLAPGGYTCAIPDLAPGDVNSSCVYVYTVTQADVDRGELTNTATVAATDPFDNAATDSDTITTDGPDEDPALEATKLADVPATTLGSIVTFTLLVENTGTVSLDGVETADTMTRADGTLIALDTPFAFVSGDTNGNDLLTPGEIWTYTATRTITQADINAGGFSNVAVVTGVSPFGIEVEDTADDGDDGDGNSEDDPTVVEITADPVLRVEKAIVTSGSAMGDEVVFEIRARNAGNVDITNVSVADTLSRADGSDISAEISGPLRLTVATDNGDAVLDPGEVWVWEVRYTLVQADLDEGGISNTATVTGEAPSGAPVSDVSADDDPSDGNISDDPTVLELLPMPALDVVKTVATEASAVGEVLVFEVAATNSGDVTLSDFAIDDTMTDGNGDPLTPDSISVSGLTTDGTLAPGDVAIYTVSYTLTQSDLDSGGIENTASVAVQSPSGLALSDVSDDGDDGDGNTTDDPTVFPLEQIDTLDVVKEASIPTRIAPDLYEVVFTITVENTGNVTQTGVTVTDDLAPFVTPAVLTDVATPVISGFASGSANGGYDGVADTATISDGELAPGDIGTVVLTVMYDTSTGFPAGVNTVSVLTDRIETAVTAEVEIELGDAPDILATKTVTPSNPLRGGLVTYTLTFTNQLDTAEANLTLIDDLPGGVLYLPESATFNGAETPAPDVAGRRLSWEPVDIAPGDTVTITFQARVTGGPGEYVNQAYALDPGGNRVSNTATATFAIRPEAVFDCGDVIGKVFDDRNQNGYQDGPGTSRGVTDDSYEGKFARPAPQGSEGEPGLPNVRVVTLRGTVITTDEYGRFNVPCAELPGETGQNFTLKLDTRSLPTGYRLTTENPRVLRLTAGKIAKMNFGAAIGNLIDIDLLDAAFVPGTAKPKPALAQGVDQIVTALRDTPSMLRLSYYLRSEDDKLVRKRLDMVEDLIRARWKRVGRYKLTIERTIKRVQ